MPIASSGAISIGNAAGTDRSINAELGRTHNTANSRMEADLVTTAVTGSTPREDGTVAQARPHAFSEWYSYAHTQDFGTPTYYVRTGTGTSDYCVFNECDIVAGETEAGAATIFFMKLNGTTVEFYVDPSHVIRYSPTQPGAITSLSETAHYKNTSGTTVSFSGNHSSGFTPVKIAQLYTGSVSGLQARIYSQGLSGIGTYVTTEAGYTLANDGILGNDDTGWRTPHASTLYGVGVAALTLPVAFNGNWSERTSYHRIVCEVKATGYNTKTFNKFVSYLNAYALSDADVPE